MNLPLNLVIDRTEDGKLRAEVAGHPESAVEATDVTGLLDAVQDTFLQFLVTGPRESKRSRQEAETAHGVPQAQDVEDALTDEKDEALRRAAMQRTPDRETLEKLVSRYPVPDRWPEGDEDWDDAP
jgi:hypothetical protein